MLKTFLLAGFFALVSTAALAEPPPDMDITSTPIDNCTAIQEAVGFLAKGIAYCKFRNFNQVFEQTAVSCANKYFTADAKVLLLGTGEKLFDGFLTKNKSMTHQQICIKLVTDFAPEVQP